MPVLGESLRRGPLTQCADGRMWPQERACPKEAELTAEEQAEKEAEDPTTVKDHGGLERQRRRKARWWQGPGIRGGLGRLMGRLCVCQHPFGGALRSSSVESVSRDAVGLASCMLHMACCRRGDGPGPTRRRSLMYIHHLLLLSPWLSLPRTHEGARPHTLQLVAASALHELWSLVISSGSLRRTTHTV